MGKLLLALLVGTIMGFVVAARVKKNEPRGYRLAGLFAGFIATGMIWAVAVFMW